MTPISGKAASAPRIDLPTPDLAPYRAGNTGVPYYTTFDSGRPGPHLMINALIHGNELCGAVAVDHLMRAGIRPASGRLTLGFANVAAYQRFDPEDPTRSRYVEEDMNRLWDQATLDGRRRTVERDRAREIRPLVDTVDHLLDIHSMHNDSAPLMLAGPLAKGRDLALSLGAPEYVVLDAGHAAGRRLRDYGAFADPSSPRSALLVECGQHWDKRSGEVAIDTVYRFLARFDAISWETAEPHLLPAPPHQRLIEVTDAVTIATDRFVFEEPYTGLEVVPEAGTPIARDGDRPIVTPYDRCVLIMPSRRLRRGLTAVRLGRFVA
ncbi:MAG: succinylglutamate desuccinylase/aspartoacylase family protein [Azospirillaceae bacterium]